VREGNVDCWIKNLDQYVQRETDGETALPIADEIIFTRWLMEFIEKDPKGIDAYRSFKLGFLPDKNPDSEFSQRLQYSVITALSIGSSKKSREFKLPIYEAWETTVEDFVLNAPPGL